MKIYSILLIAAVLTTIQACTSSRKAQKAVDSITIVPRQSWNALEPKPYKTHTPTRITVHHEGTRLEKTDDAPRKIYNIQKWGMGPDRNWADIPYHFLIAPDGTIYEGRAVTMVGETATEYDPSGHLLITCLGNYEQQEVPQELITSLTRLIAYCSRKYNIPVETLTTHKDNSKQTNCPGKNLYEYFQNGTIMKKVQSLL